MNQPPRRPGQGRPLGGEFAESLGDRQIAGTPNIRGIIPTPTDAPVGLAPPSPLQVQSVFDTRPIAGYDFAFDGFFQFGGEAGASQVEVQVPNGYTAVLRRVEWDFVPAIAMATSQVGAGGPPSFSLTLLRDGGGIPNNVVRLRGLTSSYEWATHQVFAAQQFMGARLAFAAGGADPIYDAATNGMDVTVRFFGVLIPSRALPAVEEVGSDPVLVRDYVELTQMNKGVTR